MLKVGFLPRWFVAIQKKSFGSPKSVKGSSLPFSKLDSPKFVECCSPCALSVHIESLEIRQCGKFRRRLIALSGFGASDLDIARDAFFPELKAHILAVVF
jgi:hypothetical protein